MDTGAVLAEAREDHTGSVGIGAQRQSVPRGLEECVSGDREDLSCNKGMM